MAKVKKKVEEIIKKLDFITSTKYEISHRLSNLPTKSKKTFAYYFLEYIRPNALMGFAHKNIMSKMLKIMVFKL